MKGSLEKEYALGFGLKQAPYPKSTPFLSDVISREENGILRRQIDKQETNREHRAAPNGAG